MTIPFRKVEREEKQDAPEMKLRTIDPDPTAQNKPGVNIILMAADYGPGQLEEIDGEIAKLEARLEVLRAERKVTQQLYEIAFAHQSSRVRMV